MPKVESFDLLIDLIEADTFAGKFPELTYMLHLLEMTGRLSWGQCEELRRLATVKENAAEAGS